MVNVKLLYDKVINGEDISKSEALELYNEAELKELSTYANKIREHFCNNTFDICTIVNAKSGRCSENCKFCAQSAYNHTHVNEYPLLSKEEILEHAIENDKKGVLRYSIVTSGRKLNDKEVDSLVETIKEIKAKTKLEVCVSCGLLTVEQFKKLYDAGASRVHNNLETSEENFKNVCTTHTFQDKIEAIKRAQKVGFEVCSGGIMGLGETTEDRVDMALSIRKLGIKSTPINMLNAIEGTPFEKNKKLTDEEMQRIVAVYRFILPKNQIRLAGGRGIMQDKGVGCFVSGANATISGDMLTTQGITVKTDMQIIKDLGYIPRLEK